MQGPEKDRWMELCQLAATEKDPERLVVLVEEINRLLMAKEERLKHLRKTQSGS